MKWNNEHASITSSVWHSEKSVKAIKTPQRARQNGYHITDNIFKFILFICNFCILVQILRKIKQALLQIMTWHWAVDMAFSLNDGTVYSYWCMYVSMIEHIFAHRWKINVLSVWGENQSMTKIIFKECWLNMIYQHNLHEGLVFGNH